MARQKRSGYTRKKRIGSGKLDRGGILQPLGKIAKAKKEKRKGNRHKKK